MPEPVTRGDTSNFILKRLSADDFAVLQPQLEPVRLPVRKMLEVRNRRIKNIYFMESGFASVVADGANRPSIEVGLIGREGMTGIAMVMSADRPAHETFMQASGHAFCLSADSLRRASAIRTHAASAARPHRCDHQPSAASDTAARRSCCGH